MRSGNSAQVKKIIQQKNRIHQKKNQLVMPFNANEFNTVTRTKWILSKQHQLEKLDFLCGEFLLVTLLEQITLPVDQTKKVIVVDLTAQISTLLNKQNYLCWQYFVKLTRLLPVVSKFLVKVFKETTYFMLTKIPTNEVNQQIVVGNLANNLSQAQGMPQLSTQYQQMFVTPNQELNLTVISELYRGITPQSLLNTDTDNLRVNNTLIVNVMDKVISFTKDANVINFIEAFSRYDIFTTKLTDAKISAILQQIVPVYWQPNGDNFGLGHQLALFVKKYTNVSGSQVVNWNVMDRLIAITSLNYQLQQKNT